MKLTPGMRIRSRITNRYGTLVGPNPEREDMVLVRIDPSHVTTAGESGVTSWHVSNVAPIAGPVRIGSASGTPAHIRLAKGRVVRMTPDYTFHVSVGSETFLLSRSEFSYID